MSAQRRPGSDSPFSKLFTDPAYGLVPEPTPVETSLEPVAEPISAPVPAPMAETPAAMSAPIVQPEATAQTPMLAVELPPLDAPPRRRGRPATGKRSDPNWLGRTFYINKDVDRKIEIALLKLKQSQGIELDKSELVNGLLAAWLQAQLTGQAAVSMAEILKIQRSQDALE